MAERIRQRVDDPVIHQRLMLSGFPNSLIDGAANASRKFPPSAQMGVNWVTLFLEYLWSHGHFRFDVDVAEEAKWVKHVKAFIKVRCCVMRRVFSPDITRTLRGMSPAKLDTTSAMVVCQDTQVP